MVVLGYGRFLMSEIPLYLKPQTLNPKPYQVGKAVEGAMGSSPHSKPQTPYPKPQTTNFFFFFITLKPRVE